MTKLDKFLIGGAATSLLTLGAHASTGENYVNDLEGSTAAALTEAGIGVEVNMLREPAVSRVVVLSGDIDDRARVRAEEVVGLVNGVAEVRWGSEGSAPFGSEG